MVPGFREPFAALASGLGRSCWGQAWEVCPITRGCGSGQEWQKCVFPSAEQAAGPIE